MIRLPEVWEEPLPELTAAEKVVVDSIDFEKVWAECEAQLPIDERLCWKVTDRWGNTIKRYKTKAESLASAIERNKRAKEMGLYMRYRIGRDQGWDG